MPFVKNKAKKTFFIDLDGTLVDISKKYYQIYLEFMGLICFSPLSKTAFWNLKRNKQSDRRIENDSGLKYRYEKYFLERIEQSKYLKSDSVIKGVYSSLNILKQSGGDLHLLTLRRSKKQLMKQLVNFRLDQYFTRILTKKPNLNNSALNYLEKVKLISRTAKEGDVIIGDSVADIKCGKELNLVTVGVLSGICTYSRLRSLQPDYLVRDINSIKNII